MLNSGRPGPSRRLALRRAPSLDSLLTLFPSAHPVFPRAQVTGDWSAGGTAAAAVACATGKFFDPNGLQCLTCPDGASVAADGLSCECAANTYWQGSDGTSPYGTCVSCAAQNMAVSWDNTTCMSCDAGSGATYDATAGECVCANPTTEVLVEFDDAGVRLAAKKCVTCPTASGRASVPHPDEKGKCFSCPMTGPPGSETQMTYDASTKTCLCPTGNNAVAGCFDRSINVAKLEAEYDVTIDTAAYTLNYYDMRAALRSATVESLHYAENLVDAASDCLNYGNRTRCNHLANMCVLTMYDTTSAACKLYEGIVDDRKAIEYHSGDGEMNDQSPGGWSETMPWLFYSTGTDYVNRADLGITVTFDSPSDGETDVSNLVFVLSVSTLSGEWLGFKTVGKMLQLCGGQEADLSAWQRFGTNYYNDCSMSVADALDAARGFGVSTSGETLFFDLYLQDLGGEVETANAWPERLYPVPVKVSNVAVNQNDRTDDDVYVRRFFMIDETAGVKVEGDAAVAVTYAQTMHFDIRMRSDQLTKIYPPVVALTYASRDPSYDYTASDDVSFRVVYSADDSKFWESWWIIFITIIVLAGAAWLYGVMQVSRRRQTRDPDAKSMLHAVGTGANAIASGLTIAMLWASGYFFLFYKAQTEVYTMVPLDEAKQVKVFKEMLDVAVSLAAVGVAYLVYWQCDYDIFFLDWERPRTSSTPSGKIDAAPVSAWRKMFIANEWNELQSRRITSRELTLLLMVLFLEGLNYQNLAIIEPSMGTEDPRPYQVSSLLLRFAVGAGLMLIIVACQVVYKLVWHHNYVEHPIQQFVDLLGMANLSIIILDDECAGYYIHGRSLMTFADTSLSELVGQMQKEQEMQVSARGLVPNSAREDLAENQCFELFITKELRMAYESKLLRRIEETAAMRGGGGLGGAMGTIMGGGRAGRAAAGAAGALGRAGGAGAQWGQQGGYGGGGLPVSNVVPDQTLAAAEEISDIFKQLINFTEANAASFVLERPYTDRLMNMPPESVSMMQGASPIFYHDLAMSFQRVIFYGIEWYLVIFDLLVFTAIDKELGSFAIAAFLTWLVGSFVDHLRVSFGEANISRKSLIDSRFLI